MAGSTPQHDNVSPASQPDRMVYLNGRFIPRHEAHIDIEDRGFLFADGVYEVIRYYNGRAYEMHQHVQRLTRSLQAINIRTSLPDQLAQLSDTLIARNNTPHASVYWQVTRGSAAPRQHLAPANMTPTVMAIVYPAHDLRTETSPRCIAAITLPDLRWARCDIKSLMLLPNVIAKATAHDTHAHEAILHRDDHFTEGSSTSVLFIRDGVIQTHPANQWILDSVTRRIILTLARKQGLRVIEQPLPRHQLDDVQEIMIAGTTTHIAAVTSLDGKPISDGHAGPLTRRLHQLLTDDIFRQCP